MKIEILKEEFPSLDAIVNEMPYKYAKPLVDFMNSHIVDLTIPKPSPSLNSGDVKNDDKVS